MQHFLDGAADKARSSDAVLTAQAPQSRQATEKKSVSSFIGIWSKLACFVHPPCLSTPHVHPEELAWVKLWRKFAYKQACFLVYAEVT